ncbi:hypothetical protein BU17DRAFT_94642 [Hysterangium stoloniferum]|nr:hypothetical protein BU17DRAFT_94642 [Hysterangium stoloniferum]
MQFRRHFIKASLFCLLVACIVMDLPSEPSTPECNRQNISAQDYQQCLQYAIPAPVLFLFAPPANPLHNNQQDPFAIAGSSCNIAPPANPLPNNQQDPFTIQNPFAIPGLSHNVDGPANPLSINQRNPFAIAGSSSNIHVQLVNGPQLASSSRQNPAALQPPAEVGRAAVEALFYQAALNPAPLPPNHRRKWVAAIQAQAAALPLQ